MWETIKDTFAFVGTVIVALLMLFFIVGVPVSCIKVLKEHKASQKEGVWYKEYELSVKCPNDLYDGNVYQMGHSTSFVYQVWYVEKESNLKVDLPDSCVKIRVSELPKP